MLYDSTWQFIVIKVILHYARFWRLTPSLKISRSSDQDENRTSRSQTLKVTCVKVSAQKSKVFGDSDFLKICTPSWSSKKCASKKIFKRILKCLRNMSLTPKYFSQYPGDPSFSFLCNLNFFDQLENFLEISL